MVLRIRPARETSHEIELTEETADDVVTVATLADVIELGEGLSEGGFDFGDGVFGKAFTLFEKPLFVLQELFTIEVGARDRNTHGRRPRLSQQTSAAVCDTRHRWCLKG